MSWQGKRVLVTGAGGFIGSHLAEKLTRLGATTRAFVHYNALGACGWLDSSDLRSDMELVRGDLRDPSTVLDAMGGVETVFHLGALIAIPYSYRAPDSYVQANVIGTLNVLQACRAHGVSRLVHTSTSEVYGTAQYVPIDEKHPLQGQSPYSASKIGADKLAEAFHLSFETPVVTVRPFNTFGPRQSTRAIVPTIIAQCLAGGQLKLGRISPTRDLNYVADTVEGFLSSALCDTAVGRTINIGSGREISIGQLAHLIASIMGVTPEIACDDTRLRPENSEVDRLLADASLAHRLLGWSPRVTLEDGLRATIDWVRAHREGYQADVYAI